MKLLKNILAIVFLVLFQVIVMNGIYHTIGVLPCIYIYFLFIIPIRLKPLYLFILSFAIGLGVDIFTDTLGINALSSLVMSMVYYILTQNLDRSKLERNNIDAFGAQAIGTIGYIRTMAIITFLHHFLFFTLSDWSSAHFFDTLMVIFISGISTVIFMLIFDVLFFKNKI
jgi:rod shape-determining protein MreD